MPTGIYISVPFCRSKCTFCNFASGVFSREKMGEYVARIDQEIQDAESLADKLGAELDMRVDSIYLGGGTPTTLAPDQLRQLFEAVQRGFEVQPGAEITVECAPGTLAPEILGILLEAGTNRISLGTQSFVDEEIRSVGRLHTAQQTLIDIKLLGESGIDNVNVDLIAGLPHQSPESWRRSLGELAQSGVPHASVYILEVDEDSRLGRELIAGGSRYHAHAVPQSDLCADLYLEAIEFLAAAGLQQYEISNFARPYRESKHNLKYWTRQPYLGFGVDAHSMLRAKCPSSAFECVRFSNTDELGLYTLGGLESSVARVSQQQAREESMFLGLRLNRGIRFPIIEAQMESAIRELVRLDLLEKADGCLRLTSRGRLLSNEVFERCIGSETVA
ncbi:MAG: radical SAM family heme chaperone HemW [Terriglobales bacterium]|jgi:oxygen-independent coproporphyrinogen-3 oxidase